ncbi:MAG: flippase [Candidatus Pacebacteria bacterium]|nr:flippase [Candidatus Paceibacterota bacterium]
MELSKKIAFNTLIQVIGRIGVILISLFTTAMLTRRLGQGGYGAFGVINTAVVIFFSFADWGTNLIAVREAAKKPEETGKIFANSLFLRTLMAFLGIIFFIFFIWFNPSLAGFRDQALSAALIILFLSVKTSAQIVFHARLKLYWTALIELLASILFLIFLLFWQEIVLGQAIFALIVTSALSAGGAIIVVLKTIKVDFRLNKELLLYLLKESLPMGALLTVYSVYSRADTFILQFLKGETVTGLYLLAYKVHDNLVLGAAYLMGAFFPVIVNLANSPAKHPDLKNLIQRALDLLIVMALIVVAGVLIFAPLIIRILGGEEFGESLTILRILILTTGFAYLNHLSGYSLAALGKQRIHLRFSLIALFLNIILNFLFIPRFSYSGAAGVSVLTEGLIFVLTFSYLRRATDFDLKFFSFPKTIRQLIGRKERLF